ncbi:hypothetical protein E4U44_000933 [Claviceps purpurea]|nr:hypothetical protein E4U44_000933 [Claviceps purpurea]
MGMHWQHEIPLLRELRRLGTDTMAKAEVQTENEAYYIMYGWDSALSRFRLPVVWTSDEFSPVKHAVNRDASSTVRFCLTALTFDSAPSGGDAHRLRAEGMQTSKVRSPGNVLTRD